MRSREREREIDTKGIEMIVYIHHADELLIDEIARAIVTTHVPTSLTITRLSTTQLAVEISTNMHIDHIDDIVDRACDRHQIDSDHIVVRECENIESI